MGSGAHGFAEGFEEAAVMFGLMDGDGGGDQRRRSFLMLDDLVVLGLQQRLRMKRRGRRQVMLRQSRLRLQLDVHVGGLRFGMMMLRQVMVGRDVLNLDLMNLLGLMVNLRLLLLRLLLRRLLLLGQGRMGGLLRWLLRLLLLLLLMLGLLRLEDDVVLRRAGDGFGLSRLRGQFLRRADVPRAGFAECDESNLDVRIDL